MLHQYLQQTVWQSLLCLALSDFLHQLYEKYACAEELTSLQEGEQAVTALMPHPPGAENDPDDRNVHIPAGEYHNDPDEPGGQVDDGSGEHGQHEHAMWAHDPNNQQLQQLQEVVMSPLPLPIRMSGTAVWLLRVYSFFAVHLHLQLHSTLVGYQGTMTLLRLLQGTYSPAWLVAAHQMYSVGMTVASHNGWLMWQFVCRLQQQWLSSSSMHSSTSTHRAACLLTCTMEVKPHHMLPLTLVA